MVERVERFRPELECYSFRELERLSDVHVPIVDSRVGEDIPPAVTELGIQRGGKARGIEPVRNGLWTAVRITAGNQVGALIENIVPREISIARRREGEPFLHSDHATDLPSTD